MAGSACRWGGRRRRVRSRASPRTPTADSTRPPRPKKESHAVSRGLTGIRPTGHAGLRGASRAASWLCENTLSSGRLRRRPSTSSVTELSRSSHLTFVTGRSAARAPSRRWLAVRTDPRQPDFVTARRRHGLFDFARGRRGHRPRPREAANVNARSPAAPQVHRYRTRMRLKRPSVHVARGSSTALCPVEMVKTSRLETVGGAV